MNPRFRPDCGHKFLRECPLTTADWEAVFHAYLAFRLQCSFIAECAHAHDIDNDQEPAA